MTELINKYRNIETIAPEFDTITNKEWQVKFAMYRLNTKLPTTNTLILRRVRSPNVLGMGWYLSSIGNSIESQDYRYCRYINDVLTQIRQGNIDYCYYTYQVLEVLNLEPRLETELVNEDGFIYCKVWIPFETF